MNDHELEKLLRELPVPELPEAWRAGILARARRGAAVSASAAARGPLAPLAGLWRLGLRHPVTAGALAVLWLVIVGLRVATPVDTLAGSADLARIDPNAPLRLVSVDPEKMEKEMERWNLEESGEERPLP